MWDLASGSRTQKLTPDSSEVGIRSVDIAANGTLATACNSAGKCFLWNPRSTFEFEHLKTFQAHDEYILKCTMSPDVKYVGVKWDIVSSFDLLLFPVLDDLRE